MGHIFFADSFSVPLYGYDSVDKASVTLQETAEQGVDWLKSQGLEAELYLSQSEERGIERRDGQLDGVQQSVVEGAGLRILSGGRMSFACAAGVSLGTVQRLHAQAVAQLPHLEEVPVHQGVK